jgi:hypothetical protein
MLACLLLHYIQRPMYTLLARSHLHVVLYSPTLAIDYLTYAHVCQDSFLTGSRGPSLTPPSASSEYNRFSFALLEPLRLDERVKPPYESSSSLDLDLL